MPKTLQTLCADYFPGDILLKRKRHAHDWLHKLIIQGQLLPGNTHPDPYFIHAAIVGAYGAHDKIPLTYEVASKGLYSSHDHKDDPEHEDMQEYKDMTSETWVRYRWVTDFDEEFAQIMEKGKSQTFLEETVQPLLKLAPNPFKLEEEQASIIKEQIPFLELHLTIDRTRTLLNEGHKLRQFIKACAVFALRERVVQWAKLLYEAKSVRYNHWGAVTSVLGTRFRQSHLTEQQLNGLLKQEEISPASDSPYFCSQFVVQLWTLAPLDLLPDDMSYHQRKYFLPLKMNLEAASPAGLYTYFQENPEDWKTVIGLEERYRVTLLKRILQTAISQGKYLAHLDKIKPLMQWYELLDYLEWVLSGTISWTKDSFGWRVLEALQPWHPTHQSFAFPVSVPQVDLLKAILKHLPSSAQKLAKRIFPEGALIDCSHYEDLLAEAAMSRAVVNGVDTLEAGYLKPLAHFLGWTEETIKTYPQAALQGTHCLLKSAVDYVSGLLDVLSSRPLGVEEKTALQFIETGVLSPLEVAWGRFWGLLSPHELISQLNSWGQEFLRGFLRYRRAVDNPTVTHPLLSVLEDYPDETGWTVKAQQKSAHWQQRLKTLQILNEIETDYRIETVEQGKPYTYFLNQDIGNHLFNKAFGRSHQAAVVSTQSPKHLHYINDKKHVFYRHGDILFKLQRKQSDTLLGAELIVHHLHDALGLDVLPPSALWCVKVQKGTHKGVYYCWVSEFVEGDLLGHVMKQDPQRLWELSPTSVSGLYVLALVSSQEDGNPFNISVSPEPPYHLRAFDVGHAFILPLLPSRWRGMTRLELKSMIFLLPQMNTALSLIIQEKVGLLNVPLWVKTQQQCIQELALGWSQLLTKENRQWASLIELPGTAWPWVQFVLTDLQTRLQKDPILTHEALFAKLLPMVASDYHQKRLALTKPEAYRTFDFTELNKWAYNEIIIRSPEGSTRTFITSRDHHIIRQLQQQGDRRYRELLSNSTQNLHTSKDNFRAIKLKRYAFVLLQALNAHGVKEVDLSKNLLVQDKQIVIILNRLPSLEKLDIHGCAQLTGEGWLNPTLFQHYPKLKLDISGTRLEYSAFWNSDECSHHVLSWTKPRKTFLDQFERWEKSGWALLETQPLNLSLTAEEEAYLSKNAHRYKAAINMQNFPSSSNLKKTFLENLSWADHPLLRYKFFFELFKLLLWNETINGIEANRFVCKIMVTGACASGKTQLINRFVNANFSMDYKDTADLHFSEKSIKWNTDTLLKLQILVHSNRERFIDVAQVVCEGTLGIIGIFDITRPSSWKETEKEINLLRYDARDDDNYIPLVLLANKWDEIDISRLMQIEKAMDDFCQKNNAIKWFKASAKENYGIDEAFRYLMERMLGAASAPKQNDIDAAGFHYLRLSPTGWGKLSRQIPQIEEPFYLCMPTLIKLYEQNSLYRSPHWGNIINTIQYLYDIDENFFKHFKFSESLYTPFHRCILDLMKGVSFEKLDLSECNILLDEDIIALVRSSPQLYSLEITASQNILGNGWLEYLMNHERFKKLIIKNLDRASTSLSLGYKLFQNVRIEINNKGLSLKEPENFLPLPKVKTQRKHSKNLDDLSVIKNDNSTIGFYQANFFKPPGHKKFFNSNKIPLLADNTWAEDCGINYVLNKYLSHIAHIIQPGLSSTANPFSSQEGLKDYIARIAGYYAQDGSLVPNGFIHDDEGELKKPIIMVMNTHGVLASNATDINTAGGQHWVTCAILPKKFTVLEREFTYHTERVFLLTLLMKIIVYLKILKMLLERA